MTINDDNKVGHFVASIGSCLMCLCGERLNDRLNQSDINMEMNSTLSQNARKRVLYSVICATCHECGFGTADKLVLDTLLQMIVSLICELGRSSRAYCELTGRTEPLVGDVVMAMVEMGLSIDSISSYGLRGSRVIIPTPAQMPKQSLPKILQAGEKKSLFHYIPDYFPPFPDPHAYIRTPTHKQPVTEYEAIREKSASQKRDVERALTRFMAKTCEPSLSHSLFGEEQMSLFPLIALKVSPNAYLQALLPKDQVFDDDEDDDALQKKDIDKKQKTATPLVSDEMNATANNDHNNSHINESITNEETNNNENKPNNTSTGIDDVYDNPYLRPVKSCRKRTRKQPYFDN